MLTTREFADHFNVAYTTVMTWLKKGLIPDAKRVDAPRGPVWEIPATVTKTFSPPKIGRPRAKSPKKKT